MDPAILELDSRRSLFSLVRERPGLHLRELERRLEMRVALLEHHLRVLIRAGMVEEVKEGGYTRFFPIDSGSRRPDGIQRRRIGLLRHNLRLRVVLNLLATDVARHSDIAAALRVAPSKLSYHLRKLEDGGLVIRVEQGTEKGFALADRDEVLRLLIEYGLAADLFDDISDLWQDLDLF